MLAHTLQQLIDQELTSAREISELAGVAASTVYRWIAGQSQPDFNAVRLLVRHLPNAQAQEALLSAFTAGTCWSFSRAEMDLDVNADGCIDTEDALDASIEAVRCAGETLANMRKAHQEKAPTADQTLSLICLLNQVARQCSITQGILVELSEQRQRRKLKLAE